MEALSNNKVLNSVGLVVALALLGAFGLVSLVARPRVNPVVDLYGLIPCGGSRRLPPVSWP